MSPGSGYVLGGPVFWLVTVVLFLAGMVSAFVSIDSVRRLLKRSASPRLWAYLVPQAIFLAVLLLSQGAGLPRVVTGILVLLTPLALAQQAAYLLRVVFPKQVPPTSEGPAAAS